MHNRINLHDEHALVQTHVITDDSINQLLNTEDLYATALSIVCEGGEGAPPGYQLPDADAYARRLAEEAEAWLYHARARSLMKEETLVSKALYSLAFALRHRAHDLAVPTKLSGTSKHQKSLWQLTRDQIGFGTPLGIEDVVDGKRVTLLVSFQGEPLGEVQSKHVGWLRPLLPFGAGVWLTRVTGHEERYTLGVNVAIGRVGSAVAALNHALGHDRGHALSGDGYGGDGAATAPVEATPTAAQQLTDHGGDGAAGGLRLISSGLPVAKPQKVTRPDSHDVVLYREIDGTARATVNHVVRHNPTGLEWGYHGSGPADLARSILLAFTDEATAERLYQAFKAEVVALVPEAGGVIRAADVRAFLRSQRSNQR